MSTTSPNNGRDRRVGGMRARLSQTVRRRITTGLWPNRAFVAFWAADSISQFGSQISNVALPLLAALTLGASPFEMGSLAAAGSAPFLVVALFAGAWVDRLPRRPILIAADLGSFGLLLTIPFAAWRGWLSMEMLYIVAFLTGTLTVCFNVARVAYLPALVKREELTDANSKLAATASVAQVGGPSAAGGMVALVGAPLAIFLDAVSFLSSAWLIGHIRVEEPRVPARRGKHRIWRETGEGIGVVASHPLLRALTACSATMNLGGFIFLAVYILYMTGDLGLGPGGVGLVFGLGGVGALAGATIAPTAAHWLGVGPTIIWAQLLTGLGGLVIPLAMFAPGIALPLVLFAEFFQWMVLVVYDVNALSLRQAVVPDRLRGRVTATIRFITGGMQPIGALLGGILGELIGLRATLVIGVLMMLAAFLWVAISPLRAIKTIPHHEEARAPEVSLAPTAS